MTPDDDDLLAQYRAHARQMPAAALDRQILAAARVVTWRRRAAPALLAAASVLIAFYVFSPDRKAVVAPRPLDTSRFGMNDGRAAQFLSNPEEMRQSAFEQMPGGR